MRTFTFYTLFLFSFLASNVLSAQWQSIDNPSSVSARYLVQLGDRLLAGTPGGLYESTDAGENWSIVFTGDIDRGSVSDLVADGENAIIRTVDHQTGVYQILTTNNGGASWRTVTLSASFNDNYRGMVYNGQTIIYRDSRQAYISYDDGVTWTTLLSTLSTIPSTITSQSGLLYVTSTNGKLFRSVDPENGGWEELGFPIANPFAVRLLVSGDTLLTGDLGSVIYYSHDGGENWAEATGITEFDFDNEGFWKQDSVFFTINDGDLFRSADGGMSWTATTGNQDIFNDVLPTADGLFILKSGEVYFSADEGVTLISKNNGFNGSSLYHWQAQGSGITYYDENRRLFHATLNDRAFTVDSSLNFELSLMDEMLVTPEDDVYYVGSNFGNQTNRVIRISPTGEQTEVYVANNQPWLASDHLEYADDKLFYFANDGFSRYSEDKGATWKSLSDLNPRSMSDYARHENAVFAIFGNRVERKIDGETEWVDVSAGSPLVDIDLGTRARECRLISTEGALFALLSPSSQNYYEIFVSNDGGDTWQQTAANLPEIQYPTLNAPPGVKELVSIGGYHIMAARDVGVAVSADQGLNWTIYNDGLPTDRVEELQVINGKVIVSTFRNGFWELDPASIQLQEVTGMVYFDANANGSPDADEPGLSNVKLLLEDDEDLTFTNNDGTYKLLFRNDGNFGPEINNPYFTSSPVSRNTEDAEALDFGLQLNETGNDLRVSLETDNVHRPGFGNRYYLRYENRAAASADVVLTLSHDPLLEYGSASRTPDEIVENTLTFNLGALAPLETGRIVLDFTVPRTAVLGTIVSSVATIRSTPDTDLVPEDNTATLTDGLVGSYDPNDITVDETILSPVMVRDGQVLNYRIRFQNTGTYPAETVIVRNDIDPGLLLGSITNIEASHTFELKVENDRTLAFVFNDIQLADSTRDEAASHGYITYSILVDEDVAVGDSIFNQAAIFFDFNLPIITNKVATVIEIPDATRDPVPQLSGMVYPNPIRRGEVLSLKVDGPAGELAVYDQLGRRVQHLSDFYPATQRVKTRDLRPGVYFLSFASAAGRVGMTLVVE
ncbi:MAG: T9SS type A sorting domain-containing protein [Lewinella sp.]